MEATLPKIDRSSPPPAVLDERWLPEATGWPELDKLRAEHVRLRRASADAAGAARALEETYEAEDTAKTDAYREAVASGAEPDLPSSTPHDVRSQNLRDASARSRAAYGAFCDHVDHVLEF